MASLGAVRSGDYYSGSVAGIAEDPVEGFGKTCGLRFHLGSEWNLRALGAAFVVHPAPLRSHHCV